MLPKKELKEISANLADMFMCAEPSEIPEMLRLLTANGVTELNDLTYCAFLIGYLNRFDNATAPEGFLDDDYFRT